MVETLETAPVKESTMISVQIANRESNKLENHLRILENLHPDLKMSKNSFILLALEEFLQSGILDEKAPTKKQMILRLPRELKRKIEEKLGKLKNYTITQFVLDAIHHKIEGQKEIINKILKE